ncbi:MAG: lysophospholipid acyltransferase family protein [Rhodothermales bacterium]
MRTLRASYRLVLLCLLTAILTVIWLAGIPLLSQSARRRWRGTMVGLWARNAIRIMHIKLTVKGQPPAPPFFLVSNHLSYLDIILYQTQMPCVFVAKSEVAYWPVIGWLARAIGTLFINRKNRKDVVRVNTEIEQAMLSGDGVILFPEGTSSKGETVLPFKTATLATVTNMGYPAYYASVTYQTPAEAPSAANVLCWWGDMTFADHVFGVLKLPFFEATVVFGEEAVESSDRKEMALLLNERIANNFVPVV